MGEFGEGVKNVVKKGTKVALGVGLPTAVAVGAAITPQEANAAGTITPTKEAPKNVLTTPKPPEVKPDATIIATLATKGPKLSQTPLPIKTVEVKWPTPTPTERPLTLDDDINELLMKNRDNKAVNVLIMVKEWLAENDNPLTRAIGGFVLFLITLAGAGSAIVLKARKNVEDEKKVKAEKKINTDKLRDTEAPQPYNSRAPRKN